MASRVRLGGRFVKKSELQRRENSRQHLRKLHEQERLRKETKLLEEKNNDVGAGRRIIDLDFVAEQLWCTFCDDALSLKFREDEKNAGLASVFQVRCIRCMLVKEVKTSTSVPCKDGTGRPLYAVNCKSALAIMETGTGSEQFFNLMAIMNIPPIRHKAMQRAGKRVGKSVEAVARKACQDAIEEEKQLTLEAIASSRIECQDENPHGPKASVDDTDNESTVFIASPLDAAWTKCGNGRTYDSKCGFASSIGYRSKKVMGFTVRSTDCAKYRRGHDASDHDCVKNWSGSAKAMELDMAVELMCKNPDLKNAAVKVGVLIGDDDSCTTAAVQRESSHHIEKWLDRNHVSKQFSGRIYRASAKFRFSSSAVIRYLKRCFNYAVSQNHGDAQGMKSAILNTVDHTYGKHDHCKEWCQARNDPQMYVYKNLPKGQPFSCPLWKEEFHKILQHCASKSVQLAPGGSTQNNESFNQMVATRAPKSRHYGSSSSLRMRVAAAVCQKNLGALHVVEINKHANLSPGTVTQKCRREVQKKREAKAARQTRVDTKRRRLFLNAHKDWANQVAAEKEGLTYVKGMSVSMEQAIASADVEGFSPQPIEMRQDAALVYVDIETTGLDGAAQIIQLSAKWGKTTFNVFMMPTKQIHPRESEATGLKRVGRNLFCNENRVDTITPLKAAEGFVNFLKNIGSQVILLGHNILRFDAPRICKWLKDMELIDEFCSIGYGFCDTLKVIGENGRLKQEELARQHLKGDEWVEVVKNTHNAMTDCIILEGLVNHFKIHREQMLATTTTMTNFFERQNRLAQKKLHLPSLLALKAVGVSVAMCGKMAEQGITMEELKTVYEVNKRLGLEVCLGVQGKGKKARVTTSKKVIDKLELFFL